MFESKCPVVINLVFVLVPELEILTPLPEHGMRGLVIKINIVTTSNNHWLALDSLEARCSADLSFPCVHGFKSLPHPWHCGANGYGALVLISSYPISSIFFIFRSPDTLHPTFGDSLGIRFDPASEMELVLICDVDLLLNVPVLTVSCTSVDQS